jgi:hypothetical protein
MKNFLEKYNATKLETTKDESQLSLDAYKQRILKLLDENMVHFKNNSCSTPKLACLPILFKNTILSVDPAPN